MSALQVGCVDDVQPLIMSSGDFSLTFKLKLKLKSFSYMLFCFENRLLVIHESPTSRLWILWNVLIFKNWSAASAFILIWIHISSIYSSHIISPGLTLNKL